MRAKVAGDQMRDSMKRKRGRKRRLLLMAGLCLALALLPAILWFSGIGFSFRVESPPGAPRTMNVSCNHDARIAVVVVYDTGGVYPGEAKLVGHDPVFRSFISARYPKTARSPEAVFTFVSYWPFIVIFLMTALLLLWRYQQIKLPHGGCENCGYDLRAHKAGEKCPECGTVIGNAGGGG
jgi:hypothetical protein